MTVSTLMHRREKADEFVDAVLANVGVAVVGHLGAPRLMSGDDVRRPEGCLQLC